MTGRALLGKRTRREFLLTSSGALGGLLLIRCSSSDRARRDDFDPSDFRELGCPDVEIARVADLEEGVPLDFEYPEEGLDCFAVKLGAEAEGGVGPDADIVAFSYLCTHMGCSLKDGYDHAHKILGPCRCHFTTFSLRQRGVVVLGQATENLVQVELAVEGDALRATKLRGVLYGELDNRCCNDKA